MAKGEDDKGGSEYSASVRRKQTTKLKKRKPWSGRRVVTIIGFFAAALALLGFFRQSLPLQIRQVLDQGIAIFVTVRSFLNTQIGKRPAGWLGSSPSPAPAVKAS